MTTLLIDKHDVRVGDAIFFQGDFRTVSTKDIKRDPFMGLSIFGDTFRGGLEKVKVLDIRRTNPLGFFETGCK